MLGAQYDRWHGFEAAHIFPLAYEQYWNNQGYSRWLSIILDIGGIRLYTLALIVKGSLESILINDFLMIRKDH